MPDDSAPPEKTESRQTPSQPGGLTLGDGAQITIGQGDIVGRDKIVNVFASKEDARTRRDHLILLNKVKEFWVKGVLEKSVHSEAVIELGKEVAAEAVDRPHPWDMTLEVPEQPSQPISPDKKIIALFDEVEHALLILGAPGSGKTITLLELARDLIARAENDPAQPIPVVFNLSAWAERRQPLAEWLTDELSLKYQIPRKIGRKWLAADDILPLLDGLDEVRIEHRVTCVEAINTFYGEHSLAGIAVCSRHKEYSLLTAKLKFGGAILIQPLNDEQVTDHLVSFGAKLAGLYKALRLDTTLKELAASPLMLGVMSLAYSDVSLEDVLRGKLDSIEERRKHLFDVYVERMFKRKGADKSYSSEQAMKWLSWLARGMKTHGQTVFLIEGLQPDWLSADSRRLYRVAIKLIFGLVVGLVGGLAFGLVGGLAVGLFSGLAIGLVGGLAVYRLVGVEETGSEIKTVERLRWSWTGRVRDGLFRGLIMGLVSGLIVGLFFGGLVSGLIVGLVFGLVSELTLGLFTGLTMSKLEAKTAPNQGIWLSVRNAILFGLVFGLGSGLVGGLAFGLSVGLGGGLILGLGGGLNLGGFAALQHYLLRLILSLTRRLPWNLTHFLDYCADRVFLQKVGGGYIFIHRLLLEYFAEREPLKH